MEDVTTNETQRAVDPFAVEDGVLNIASSVGYVLISLLGIVGNGLVLAVVTFVPALRNITNLFIANQSLVDLISSVLLSPSFLLPSIDMSGIGYTNHGFATVLCVVWHSRFLYWACLKVSTANLMCLTLERYFAVVHPFTYRRRMNLKRAVVIALGVWVVGFSVEAPWAFSHHVAGGVCRHREVGDISKFAIASYIFVYSVVAPCIVMVFVYVSILRKLRQTRRRVNAAAPGMPIASTGTTMLDAMRRETGLRRKDRGTTTTTTVSTRDTATTDQPNHKTNSRSRARRNVLVTMLVVCLLYTICVTPNQLYFFLVSVGAHPTLPNVVHVWTVLLYSMNMCINPLIYACQYRKFQMGLRALFCKSETHVIIE